MKTYTVVGVHRISGNRKSDGQPFTMTRLHLLCENDTEKDLVGQSVLTVAPFDRVFQESRYAPTVGDVITLEYQPGFNGQAVIAGITKIDE